MRVADGGLRDEPALPAGPLGAVAEVDILAIEAKGLVDDAELVEHLARKEQEGADHPVGLHRLCGTLLDQVVAALPLLRLEQTPEGRASHDRAPDRRGAPAGSLKRSVRVAQERSGDPTPWPLLGEVA